MVLFQVMQCALGIDQKHLAGCSVSAGAAMSACMSGKMHEEWV